MRRTTTPVILFVFGSLLACSAESRPEDQDPGRPTITQVRLLQTDSALRAGEVLKQPGWKTVQSFPVNRNFSRETIWVRFRLNRADATTRSILTLDNNRLDRADLFELDSAGLPVARGSGGDRVLLHQRALRTPYPAFEARPTGDPAEFLLGVRSSSLIAFNLEAQTTREFLNRRVTELVGQWIYGILGLFYILYQVFASIALRRINHLFLGAVAFCLLFFGYVQAGDANVFLFGERPGLTQVFMFGFGFTFLITVLELTRRVLGLAEFQPRMNRVFQLLMIVNLGGYYGMIEQSPAWSRFYTLLTAATVLAVLSVQIRAAFFRQVQAYFMLVSSIGIGGGILWRTFTILDWLPYNNYSMNAGVLMAPVELLSLSLALATFHTERARRQAERFAVFMTGTESRATTADETPADALPERLRGLSTEELLAGVRRLIEEERIYEDEDLDRDRMAAQLKIRPDQLSALLTSFLNTGFTELIQTARVDAACRMIAADPERPLLEIAFQVGFGSKSAFNRIFRQVRDMTPSQFREANRAGRNGHSNQGDSKT